MMLSDVSLVLVVILACFWWRQGRQRATAVPKFGEWDATDPKFSPGYTVIFNQVKEDKKASGAAHLPTVPVQPTPSPATAEKAYRNDDSCWTAVGFELRNQSAGALHDYWLLSSSSRLAAVPLPTSKRQILIRNSKWSIFNSVMHYIERFFDAFVWFVQLVPFSKNGSSSWICALWMDVAFHLFLWCQSLLETNI